MSPPLPPSLNDTVTIAAATAAVARGQVVRSDGLVGA